MGTAVNEYFNSGANIINGQVIKTEGVTQYFNGNANQYNNNNQQAMNFDNVVYNPTRRCFREDERAAVTLECV